MKLERAEILNGEDDGNENRDGLSSGKIQKFEKVTNNGKQSAVGDASAGSHPCLSQSLLECATLAKGLSGRALRKLPFQSLAFHVQCAPSDTVSMAHFLVALKSGIERKSQWGYILLHNV